jgi:dolichol-phosphate mannosyltransferase
VTDVQLNDTGCALKAFRREVVEKIRLYGELHRFIPALARIEGARIAELVVDHHPRQFGKSKYNITRTFRVLMDLVNLNILLKYLRNPLRFFGLVGSFFLLFGILTSGWIFYRLFLGSLPVEDLNILITLTFLLFAEGFQILLFGLIASIIVKTGQRRGISLASYLTYPNEDKDEC